MTQYLPAEVGARPPQICEQCERPHWQSDATVCLSCQGGDHAPAATDLVLRPRSVDMSRVQPFRWAWQDRLLVGYLNLLVGDEGVGKGTLLAWLIARLTRGELPGDLRGKPARVLIVGDEDGFDGVWVPRLHAAGADLALVCELPVDESGALDIGRDAKKLRALLFADRFDVLIFDALLDNLGAEVDDWRAKSVRGAIAPLRRLIGDLNVTAVGALHTNKSEAVTFRKRLAGTQAFNALSRSSLLLAAHPDDPDRRVLLRGKGNYAAPPPVLEFRIAADPVRLNGHTHKPTIVTDVQRSGVTIEDVLGAVPEPQTKAGAARTLIVEALADGEWHNAREIRADLAKAGISDSGIQRACNDLDVERRRTSGFPSGHEWRLAHGGGLTERTDCTERTATTAVSAVSAVSATCPTSVAAPDEDAFIAGLIAAFDAVEITGAEATR
ncbi:MAG: AAA family ATPase [Solirubrobacteraceae bacterium]|nr:AAA family ATPase [Solirubrobacteraceae bacterium]